MESPCEDGSGACVVDCLGGGDDFVLSAARAIGQEPVPVGLTLKPFADTTIDTITTAEATQYTLVLTILPAVASLAFGIVVLIRRKNR